MIKRKQLGLSLVELMIAMTIGGVVSVGVINLFSANSETYKLMQGQSRMQESSRFALDFLTRAVQQAGYKGCYSQNQAVYFTMDVVTDIPYEFNITRGMIGYESMVAGIWSPVLAALDTPYIMNNEVDTGLILVGTDVITIRNLSSTDAPLSVNLAAAADIVVTIPAIGLEYSAASDDLALIHDCEKATIFEITGLTEAGALATIGHGVEIRVLGEPRNSFARLAEVNTYQTDASVSAIVSNTFFIAPGLGLNSEGDNPYSLWRKAGTSAPVELVEGVEDLQILYGVDTNNDGVPNQYLGANFVTNYAAVITVRISITVNSVDAVGGTTAPTFGCLASGGRQACYIGEAIDGLLRRTFHQTIQLRNTG